MGKYRVIYQEPKANLADFEITAAEILAEHFGKNVIMLKRRVGAKSADMEVEGKVWELKSPVGDGKRTMQNNLRKADKQSSRIVIDLRRCKMNERQSLSRLEHELKGANRIQQLLVITKRGEVLVLKRFFGIILGKRRARYWIESDAPFFVCFFV